MNDLLKVLIPAVIALAGTVITIVFGYRHWKRQQQAVHCDAFLADKQSAYKGLWEKLEDVHVKLRKEEIGLVEFNNLLSEVNSFILKHSLYLDEQDRTLSNQYLISLYRFKSLVADSGDEAELDAWANTEPGGNGMSDELLMSYVKEIRSAENEINEIRKVIIGRCRAVIRPSKRMAWLGF